MSYPVKAVGNLNLLFGTVQLGTTYGQVEDASEDLSANIENILDGDGNTQAVIFKDEKYELDMTVILSSTAVLPGLTDDITFPSAGVTGQITGVGRSWSAGGMVKLKLKASHWKSLGSDPAVGSYGGA